MTTILKLWVGGAVNIKIGRVGYELTYEGEMMDIFCHEDRASSGGRFTYLIEGTLTESVDAEGCLGKLARLCLDAGLTYSIDYVPIGMEGVPLGDEKVLDIGTA
ncbi:hypothetical protein ACFWUP_09415 [Nocardia sp. NPDC058658]|uniref:hypothetical protein n=1 Tax=Nocardia sp. NPDC058658 TaxID=3346580 RepID=UPI003660595F